MKRTNLKVLATVAGRRLAMVGVAALALSAAATAHGQAVAVNGSGSTFAAPLYTKWFAEYGKSHPDTQFNYAGKGSGAGIQDVTNGLTDFGGTDGPMTPKQLADFKAKRGCDVLHLPTALGAAVPTYNLPGVTAELNFTPEALAGIYLRTITKWNDPAIAGANPGVSLPDADIVVVHRADGSGTTFMWTDYLSKVSPDFKKKIGSANTVKWPSGELGGKGNDGVMGTVKQTPNAIGYVELIYAVQNHVPYGKVKNAAGQFVKADLASVSAAAAGAAANMPDDFRVSITNAPGDGAYPISSFTWMMVPSHIADATKEKAIVDLLKWGLSDGQSLLEPLSYARVPKEVVAKEEAAIEKIK